MTVRGKYARDRNFKIIVAVIISFLSVLSLYGLNTKTVHALPGVQINELPDILPPSVPKGGIPNNSYKITNDFDFSWDASTDDRAGAITYEFRSSQDESKVGSAPDSSGAWMSGVLTEPSIHSHGAPDGVWYWQVRAIDAAGNKSAWSDTWKLAIDTVKPTLTVSDPVNGQVFNEGDRKTITVHAFLQDDQGLSQYHIDIDGKDTTKQENDVNSAKFSGPASLTVITIFTATDFTDGIHTINMRVTDKAGNSTTESRTIIIDTKPPVVSTNITNEQVFSGTTPIELHAEEPNPQVYNIQVLNADGNIVAGSYDPNNDSQAFVYNWDSTSSPNGTYMVRLTATDAAGHTTTIDRTVTVYNVPSEPQPQPPVVTIEPGVDGRMIYGTVSDASSTFTVKIDGVLRNDATVHVGDKIDGGYVWYLEVPAGVAIGIEHSIEVTAHADGLDSTPANSTFTLDGGGGSTIVSGGSDPLLEKLSASLTQPFPVPADIEAGSPISVTADPATDSASILGAQTAKDPTSDTKNVPVTATNGGWKLFGLHWYWWVLILAVIALITTWIMTRMRRRTFAADV